MASHTPIYPTAAHPVGEQWQSDLPVVQGVCRALEAAWSRKLLPEPVLDLDWLVEEAARREGRSPLPGCWEEALRLLLADLNGPARLNALGRTVAYAQILRTIRQRIRAAALWRDRPAILDTPVAAPVIVLGQMRSGTTLLHRLLACDDQFSHTKLHESVHPLPRSRASAIVGTAAVLRFLSFCNPSLRHIHPSGARAPEEEFGLHAFSLHGAMLEAQWHLPGFARWSERRDLAPVYREFRHLVQTLRWQREDRQEIQLLKAPQFMQDLPALLAAFPDARIIRITRDRSRVVASTASLVWNQRRIQSDHVDPLSIGAEWQRKTEFRETFANQTLRRQPAVPLLDISFRAMEADWLNEVRTAYDFLGVHLRRPVVGRMRRVANGRTHHGHRYYGSQFGLAERDVRTEPLNAGD